MNGLDAVIRGKKIVICVGSGGVGKTTVAASIALRSAAAGRKTLVLTIDPAKRLANSLGISSLGNDETMVPPEKFEQAGLTPAAPLYAMMLDTKRAFDELIRKVAPTEEAARRILANSFYQNLSSAMAGSHEYLAMEKLYDIHVRGDYDLIVLDTPPTKQALDFLDAPQRIADFFDKDVLKWFLKPYVAAGRIGLKAMNRTGAAVFRMLERITGVEFLRDVSDFFLGFSDVFDDFRKEADEVFEVLKGDEVIFLLVTSANQMPIEEARFFYNKLREYRMPFGGFIVNRIHQDFISGTVENLEAMTDLEREEMVRARMAEIEHEAKRRFGDLAASLLKNFQNVQTLAEIDKARIADFLGSLDQPVRFWTVPFFDEDVFDLAGLLEVGGYLFDRPPTN